MMPGVSLRFGPGGGAVSAAFRLSPRDQSPALLTNACPRNELPPYRGTRFIIGPPMSDSPSPPATVTEISSVLIESRIYVDTPPPLNGAAMVMPLIAMRPSLIGPPRAAKNVIVGDSASAPSLTTSP